MNRIHSVTFQVTVAVAVTATGQKFFALTNSGKAKCTKAHSFDYQLTPQLAQNLMLPR